jgi:hypothetical protein
MSIENYSVGERTLRIPAQLAEYLAAEPQLVACEPCWERWERKLNVGERLGQTPMGVALYLYDLPVFNPACWSCVAEFEAAVAHHLTLAEQFASEA